MSQRNPLRGTGGGSADDGDTTSDGSAESDDFEDPTGETTSPSVAPSVGGQTPSDGVGGSGGGTADDGGGGGGGTDDFEDPTGETTSPSVAPSVGGQTPSDGGADPAAESSPATTRELRRSVQPDRVQEIRREQRIERNEPGIGSTQTSPSTAEQATRNQRTPEGISGSEGGRLMEETAEETPGVYAADVDLSRETLPDDQVQEIREEQAAQTREQAAEEYDVAPSEIDYAAEDVEFEEEPYQIVASVDEAGQERAAETQAAIETPGYEAIDFDTVDGQVQVTDTARIEAAAGQSGYDEDELTVSGDSVQPTGEAIEDRAAAPESIGSGQQEFQEFSEAENTVVSGGQPVEADSIGQTTDPNLQPGDLEQPGTLDAVQSGTVDFFQDPYGETFGIGVDSMEDELSEEAGFDVGETVETTGETLIDRPVDSVVTGAATIRTGGAVIADDVSEDTAAAGAAVTGTGTATGTGTTAVGALGATGAAATLPAGAAVAGARGLQEEDITLPGVETAPTPGETVEETTVPSEQYPDEIVPTGQDQFAQPEIEVTGETEAGATTTRVPVDDATLYPSEIDVTGETEPGVGGPELPLGGGETADAPAAPSDSVVPGEYPQAGQDFPADPTREYVGGTGTDLTAEAQQLVGAREFLEPAEEEEEEDELGVPDSPFLESDRRLYDPSREFGEQRSFREVDRTSGELGESAEDVGGGIAGSGTAFEPERGETVAENFEQYMQSRREEAQQSEVLAGESYQFPGGELSGEAAGETLAVEEQMLMQEAEAGDVAGDYPMEFVGISEEPDMAGEATGQGEQLEDLPDDSLGTQPDTVQEFGYGQVTETVTSQETVPGQGYDYPPDYPTEYPPQFGYPPEFGPPEEPPGPPPGLPLPEFGDDEDSDERDEYGMVSDEWVNPIAQLGRGGSFAWGDDEWP